MAGEDTLEDDSRRRRPNGLPGPPPPPRYLRNSPQNPSVEEEELRGYTDNKRKKLCMKEAESKKKRASRLFPRFGGIGAWF